MHIDDIIRVGAGGRITVDLAEVRRLTELLNNVLAMNVAPPLSLETQNGAARLSVTLPPGATLIEIVDGEPKTGGVEDDEEAGDEDQWYDAVRYFTREPTWFRFAGLDDQPDLSGIVETGLKFIVVGVERPNETIDDDTRPAYEGPLVFPVVGGVISDSEVFDDNAHRWHYSVTFDNGHSATEVLNGIELPNTDADGPQGNGATTTATPPTVDLLPVVTGTWHLFSWRVNDDDEVECLFSSVNPIAVGECPEE